MAEDRAKKQYMHTEKKMVLWYCQFIYQLYSLFVNNYTQKFLKNVSATANKTVSGADLWLKKGFLLCMKYMSESFVVVKYKLSLTINYFDNRFISLGN